MNGKCIDSYYTILFMFVLLNFYLTCLKNRKIPNLQMYGKELRLFIYLISGSDRDSKLREFFSTR